MSIPYRLLASALFLAVVTACTSHADEAKSPPPAEEGFVSIFDGKTLDGWWPHTGVPTFHVGGKWEVVDGVIVGQQFPPDKGGFLATKKKYDNFVIRFEVNMDYPSDSGVFLRMGEDGKSHQVTLDNRPDGQFGKIYLPWTQSMVHESPDGIKSFKQKEWNKGEIRIEGEPSRIRFWLNGDLVTDFQHTAETTKGVPDSGYIGLQVHPTVENMKHFDEGNKVRYRNIRIREIKPGEKVE
ncbi:3-keto-disaccharide hydrolase [Lacipirellula parvula]|uniref:3-keto-alpha-glucoside-1,2-lyase/3-keto-2-hydroxy-glucal hydratase domain-containing protein n=1 Tax=Lacipirellula parvula TaxID=2650471 RepID=A0A5K7X8C1_9BACT|nr:DUF1080 domain-containing protein [Lacipirellula parvula]BBO32798.1 hypothetical protein PLANPX_2410 [Lacipirellula parvula]